jgi:hypothetical protein
MPPASGQRASTVATSQRRGLGSRVNLLPCGLREQQQAQQHSQPHPHNTGHPVTPPASAAGHMPWVALAILVACTGGSGPEAHAAMGVLVCNPGQLEGGKVAERRAREDRSQDSS